MGGDKIEHKLNDRSVKPTAMRTMVLKYLIKNGKSISLSDLQDALDTVDKSTLYRTLKTFEKNNLVHTINDGSGKLKYALCTETCDSDVDHQHFHFTCIKCSETYCLPATKLPSVELPPDFSVSETNLVLKGICSECK